MLTKDRFGIGGGKYKRGKLCYSHKGLRPGTEVGSKSNDGDLDTAPVTYGTFAVSHLSVVTDST